MNPLKMKQLHHTLRAHWNSVLNSSQSSIHGKASCKLHACCMLEGVVPKHSILSCLTDTEKAPMENKGLWVCVKQPQLSLHCKILALIFSQACFWTAAPNGSSTSSEYDISTMVLLLLFWMMTPFSGPSRDLGPLYKAQYRCTVIISSCWWRSFHSH